MSSEQGVDVSASPVDRRAAVSQMLGTLLLVLVGVLLVEVLFEAWAQHLQGSTPVDPAGVRQISLPEWPKNLKNALYFALLAGTVAKVVVDRSWRRFTTGADIALAVLGMIMVIAGLLGGSRAVLIGEALFVYFRGVIVFYALRAAKPSWLRVRPVLWLLGGILALNSVVAIIQMIFGSPFYRWMGWLELTWANIYRAHGFVDHPNHLGHVLALGMLGLLAWFVVLPTVPRRWWWLFALFAVGLSATQSREATIGFMAAAVLIGVLRRGRWRPVIAAVLAVSLLSAAQLTLRPENRRELQHRLAGVFSAFNIGSGEEGEDYCIEGTASDTPECVNRVPQREIRVLYAQQGLRILVGRPLLGYGVGQFGGIVAEKDDPNWNMDPRFGPRGFDMHGSTQKQVDSFWLHLVVEVGLIGLAAYLVWLFLLVLPVLRVIPHRLFGGRWALRGAGPRGPTNGPHAPAHPAAYWAVAATLLAFLVAFLSPAPEDPLFPPLLFAVLGMAWALLDRGELVTADEQSGPADGPA